MAAGATEYSPLDVRFRGKLGQINGSKEIGVRMHDRTMADAVFRAFWRPLERKMEEMGSAGGRE